ncbi:MAG: LPS export ABC transporter periplasmic protein LptC [Proteobacteria bacterium]|nr:LPS export ABC transporter periplasmic protein LptC [Pseudomonadota bacterium]
MNWRLAIILALLAGAVLTGWHAWRDSGPLQEEAVVEARSDFILRDFEVISLNAEGQESFALRAPEMTQTPGGRTLELATPLFLMPVEHGGHWEVRSRTGWVSEKSDEIRLRGDVIANSPMGATRPTTVKTEELDLFPQQNLATSTVLVTTTSPGTTMQGTGMRLQMTDKRLELLSKVKLSHAPNRR